MAWPNTPLTTYVANRPPPIKAYDLNKIQEAINGIVNGTISVASLNIDGSGGNPVIPIPGRIKAQTGDFSANVIAQNLNAINSVSALNSVLSFNEMMTVTGDITSGKDVIASKNVIAMNALVGNHAQIGRSIGGPTLPNPIVPLGQINRGNLILGWATLDIDGKFVTGVNVKSVDPIPKGHFSVTFNVDCSIAAAFTSVGTTQRTISTRVVSLAPLKVSIHIMAVVDEGEPCSVLVVGE